LSTVQPPSSGARPAARSQQGEVGGGGDEVVEVVASAPGWAVQCDVCGGCKLHGPAPERSNSQGYAREPGGRMRSAGTARTLISGSLDLRTVILDA
jgi:hypothetical protein